MTDFNAPLTVEEVTPASVGPRQALVRIAASGLCHSDLLFWQGYSPVEPPIVLGHEGAGVVEEVGAEVRDVAPGDRVVCTWMTACGECWFCRRGESRLCEELALIGCGVTTGVGAVLNTAAVCPGSSVAVLGCWYGSAEVRRDFPRLIELAATGRLDVATMVTRRIALDDVNDGLAAIERGEVIRSVIVN
jgi:Zn-dependent alcohol dehydrogenase